MIADVGNEVVTIPNINHYGNPIYFRITAVV